MSRRPPITDSAQARALTSPDCPGTPAGGHPLRQWLISLGLLAALTLMMFGDVLFTTASSVLSNSRADIFLEYSHWRAFGFSELRRGNLALWNPCLFSGAPFFGGAQAALLYPLNVLFLFLPLHHAINWSIALHVFLAGAFTYAWVAHRGLRPTSCFVSAVIYMFCGANFLHIYSGYLPFLCGLVWAPLLFLAIDGLLETPSLGWSLLGMFAAAMQVLAGNPQSLFYTAIAAGLYCVLCGFQARARRPYLLGLAGIVLGGAALSAVQLFSSFQEWGEMLRSSGVPLRFAGTFSFPPENCLTLLAPNLFGDLKTVSYWGRCYLWEMSLFISVTGLVLGIVGAVWGDARSRRWSLTMIACMLLLALGAHTPIFHVLYDWVPGFNKFRGNSKFIFLASLFLALLAGLGCDALGRGRRLPRSFLGGVALIGLVLLGAGVLTRPAGAAAATATGFWPSVLAAVEGTGETYLPEDTYQNQAFVLGASRLASQSLIIGGATIVLVVILLASARKWRPAVALLLGLALVELFVFARRSLDHFDLREAVDPAIRSFLEQHPGDYRIANLYYPNSALSLHAQDVWGYEPGVVLRYAQLLAYARDLAPDQAVLLTTLDNVFSLKHPLLSLLRCRFLFAAQDGQLAVYERTNYLPHVLLVQRCRVLATRDQIFATLTNAAFDPKQEVILETPPEPAPVVSPDPGKVSLTDVATDCLTIEAELRSAAILLIPDVYAKGWRARGLPGSAQSHYRVQPADWCLRAIPLAAGHHRLRLEYAPLGFRLGRWVSLISLPLFLVLLAATIRRFVRGGGLHRLRASQGSGQGTVGGSADTPITTWTATGQADGEDQFHVALTVGLVAAALLTAWPLVGRDFLGYGDASVPLIGLFLCLAWSVWKLAARWQQHRWRLVAMAAIALTVCAIVAGRQLGQRRSSAAPERRPIPSAGNLAVARAQSALANRLLQRGQLEEAIAHYQAAITAQPANPSYLNNLAWVLATSPEARIRNGTQAVALAQQAEQLSGGRNPTILGTLAAAYAEVGQWTQAIATAQRALELATAQADGADLEPLRAQLARYQAGLPFRDATPTNATERPLRR